MPRSKLDALVAQGPAGLEAEETPALGHLEIDLACRTCGHNLRTRPIRRHPRHAALVCWCPQCRQYQALHPLSSGPSAMPVWSRFLTRALLSLWVMIVGVGGLGTAAIQVCSTLLVLELVTTHAGQTVPVPGQPRLTAAVWRYVPKKNFMEYKVLTCATVGTAMLAVAAAAAVSAAVLPHWRAVGLGLFWLLEPAVVGGMASLIWRINAPELADWGMGVIGLLAGLQVAAALGGALLGRPMLYLLTFLALPPFLRQGLTLIPESPCSPSPE